MKQAKHEAIWFNVVQEKKYGKEELDPWGGVQTILFINYKVVKLCHVICHSKFLIARLYILEFKNKNIQKH